MTTLPVELQRLSVAERIALAEALWESIPDRELPALSDARRAELTRREAEDETRPEEAVSWQRAKAEILERLGRS